VAVAAGDLDTAAAHQHEALTVASRIGAKSIIAQSMDGVAEIVAARGDPAPAAELWAAAETTRRTSRAALLAADRRRIDRAIATARACVDEATWWSAWAAGEALAPDDAIGRALAAVSTGDPGSRAAAEPASAAV
jgi:hypothetical protein